MNKLKQLNIVFTFSGYHVLYCTYVLKFILNTTAVPSDVKLFSLTIASPALP